MSQEFEPRYDPAREDEIYAQWEKSGYFNPDKCLADGLITPAAEPFSMVLPPPNVTGTLHMGHAVMLAIQDILARYYRMRGRRVLWLPGTDHSPIATQAKVESIIYQKEGKTRYDLGREALIKRVEEFAKESHDIIVNQIKKMGSSVDWGREAYTFDEKRNLAVRTAFKRMYDKGLIYRGLRIINWDPKLQTTISDDEIEWVEEKSPFYYLQYGPFAIGTSRPETKFGDKYVVVHPADKRYANYAAGQKLELEWINGPVTATVIKDEAVDMEFGSGVMTITPWHDAADFEIASRHDLEKEQIIDFNGKLLPVAGEFAGMHIQKARPLILKKLQEKGLLVKVDEKYIHNVAVNSRGGGMVEPQIKEQWFVGVNRKFKVQKSNLKNIKDEQEITLKELMRKAVESGQINIVPQRFEKIYYYWIDNLRDWCISRQLWYGHQIPVWYREKEIYCDVEPPAGEGWVQDPDTLDTWFSSGTWTFSTMGWPGDTDDLRLYHPTNLLETGYDIIFFWVARMILMTGCLLGDIPFHQVYLHGLVRDEKGRKMSKSLDNIIDPLAMTQKYGADSARLSLVIGAAPGNDVKLSEDRVRGYRNFSTKIWNISRFILMNKPENTVPEAGLPADQAGTEQMSAEEMGYLREVRELKQEVAAHIENMELHLAAEKAYHYVWHTFADKIIEEAKPRLKSGDAAEQAAAYLLLRTILGECLKMLHPFMPFVTEAVYQKITAAETGPEGVARPNLLMVQSWD